MKAKMHNYSDWVEETNPSKLYDYYNEVLLASGFKVLNVVEEHFKPYGYTALFLLGESHFAIHTFPEQDTTYIELSSCVQQPYYNLLKIITNGQK
jgi:S-adenosylmethionine/arginine decarboxylase-like enzyme|tara:strand:- start:340 stop:624 length:285 start_codon:yes stop_codon:yes gene_type:complete